MEHTTKKVKSVLLLFIYTIYTLSLLFSRKIPQDTQSRKYAAALSEIDTGCYDGEYISAMRDDIRVSSRLYELFFGKSEKEKTPLMLIPGGSVFGLLIEEDGVTVTGGSSNVLLTGDRITKINGKKMSSPSDVEQAVKSSAGTRLLIELYRAGERMTVSIMPALEDGEYKLGVSLRSHTAGIGTTTFIDPKTLAFGGLGHGVSDSGGFVSIKNATVNDVVLGGCKRGEAGKAGELTGVLKKTSHGSILANNECGVFGTLDSLPQYAAEPIPVASREEIKAGEAEIISTVKSGKRQTFKIKIYDIDSSSTGSKSFKIKVTDPTLIAMTGGIVRGMSGSPIIQNGKLVGAVTHVMVANPTEGYGIFIENMLNAAENQVQPKAA